MREDIKRTQEVAESRIDKLRNEHDGRLMKAEVLIQMMDNREVVHKFVKDSIADAKNDLINQIKKQKTYVDKKFDDIYYEHLWKPDFIGPGSECQFKSLMEYTTGKIPDMQKKIKASEDQLS